MTLVLNVITPRMTPVILTSLLNDFSGECKLFTPRMTLVILTSLLNDFSVECKLFSKVYNPLRENHLYPSK
jgi:hypothetical protein